MTRECTHDSPPVQYCWTNAIPLFQVAYTQTTCTSNRESTNSPRSNVSCVYMGNSVGLWRSLALNIFHFPFSGLTRLTVSPDFTPEIQFWRMQQYQCQLFHSSKTNIIFHFVRKTLSLIGSKLYFFSLSHQQQNRYVVSSFSGNLREMVHLW